MVVEFTSHSSVCLQTKASVGLRQPSLLWSISASERVRSVERCIRGILSETISELAGRGAALNEARCDRLLAALMSVEDSGSRKATAPAPMSESYSTQPQLAGGGYFPPTFTQAPAASIAQHFPVGGPSSGANVLGALGQRVTEAVSTHWTGLGSAFGSSGAGVGGSVNQHQHQPPGGR